MASLGTYELGKSAGNVPQQPWSSDGAQGWDAALAPAPGGGTPVLPGWERGRAPGPALLTPGGCPSSPRFSAALVLQGLSLQRRENITLSSLVFGSPILDLFIGSQMALVSEWSEDCSVFTHKNQPNKHSSHLSHRLEASQQDTAVAHLEQPAWFWAGCIFLSHAAIVNTENCTSVGLYFYISCPSNSTSANWLPIASFTNMKSHLNIYCPRDLHLSVWCLVSSFGAGTTPILAGSWGSNYFSRGVLFCRKVIRWHGLVPVHFLPRLLGLDRLKSDVSKLTTSFLCQLEAKLKLLVTWKKHGDLLLCYV